MGGGGGDLDIFKCDGKTDEEKNRTKEIIRKHSSILLCGHL